jgi:hypothetical protein
MANDGKRLENLVAYVEQALLPAGFKVTQNEKLYEDGVPVLEFDIQAHGKVGTTTFSWLIECRDRPSAGSAPRSWIEQLKTRRDEGNFGRVTAVSTMGFSAGAVSLAQKHGIELRVVDALAPEAFAEWLPTFMVQYQTRRIELLNAMIGIAHTSDTALWTAAMDIVKSGDGKSKLLRLQQTGELASAEDAFKVLILEQAELWESLEPNGPAKTVHIDATYVPDLRFEIVTPLGPVEVESIKFDGTAALQVEHAPVSYTGEYKHATSGEVISQVASFGPRSLLDMQFATEMHKITETGETQIILRRTA